MSKTSHKTYSPSEKATIALEALKGNQTLNELTKKYGVHSTQINRWKKKLKESIVEIFSQGQQKRDLARIFHEILKMVFFYDFHNGFFKLDLFCSFFGIKKPIFCVFNRFRINLSTLPAIICHRAGAALKFELFRA